MSRFVQLTSPNGELTYWVNLDNVRYMQTSDNTDYTSLKFDNQQSLSVKEPPGSILGRNPS